MMTTNELRVGNFTSSNAVKLLSSPAVRQTYIDEKNLERMLLRSVDKEANARSLSWGKLIEYYVSNRHDLLGLSYSAKGDETIRHPEIEYWSGSSDGMFNDEVEGVYEFKAPITMKSFCSFALAMEAGDIEQVRKVKVGSSKDGEKYYFQMVSNAILEGVDYAELIVYCPFKFELDHIREAASEMEDLNMYAWVNWAKDEELPYLNEGGRFKNLNKLRFKVPESDKKLLESAVVKYGAQLIDFYKD